MSKQTFIFIIIVLAVVFVGWSLLWPSLGSVLEARAALKIEQKKLADAGVAQQKIEELKKSDILSGSNYQRVVDAIPAGEDLPGLLVQLEALASQNGLILDEVNIISSEADSKKSAKSSQPAAVISGEETKQGGGLKTLGVQLSLSGDFNGLRSFLKAVENNLRLMDVFSVNINNSGAAGSRESLSGYGIKLNVYYKPIN